MSISSSFRANHQLSKPTATTLAWTNWDTTPREHCIQVPMIRIVQLVYLTLPVYVGNMAPPFVKYWRWWNRPISERWLGSHKTVLGFALGIAAAILTTLATFRRKNDFSEIGRRGIRRADEPPLGERRRRIRLGVERRGEGFSYRLLRERNRC